MCDDNVCSQISRRGLVQTSGPTQGPITTAQGNQINLCSIKSVLGMKLESTKIGKVYCDLTLEKCKDGRLGLGPEDCLVLIC